MGLFQYTRASAGNTLEAMIRAVYGGSTNSTGINVNSDTALTISAVYSCILVLSQSLGQTPIHLFEKKADGTSVQVSNHRLQRLVCDEPNEWMTDYDMKSLIMSHLCFKGNSVWLPTRLGNTGEIREIVPIHPDLIAGAEQDEKYQIFVKVRRPKTGVIDSIPYNRLLHFKGLTTNGFWGLDPITAGREMIGVAIATQKYGAKFFAKGAKMGGLLSHPRKLSEKASKNLEESFNAKSGDIEQAHKSMLLEEGVKWVPTTMESDKAQFLETRKYQRSEIAGWFRVPAHFINDLEKATFSNVEHLDLSFVKHTLSPYYVSLEKTLRKALMTEAEKARYFFKFNADGLIRGDIKSRYEAHSKAVGGPWLTANEVRELDDRAKIEGGDTLLRPLNSLPDGGNNNEPTPTS